MNNLTGNMTKIVRFLILAVAIASFWAASPTMAQQAQFLSCPDSATQHWDKIVFRITDKKTADRLQVPVRALLDIKVPDDPRTVADLERKVMDFFRNSLNTALPDFREAIQIESVAYAIAGCAAVPSNGPNPQSCTSTVTSSGPGPTTATAICGLTCSTAHVTNYTGAGIPFVSFASPNYICNGNPSFGTSSITCSC